ncbi:MAG: hypothetical protein MRY76_13465 [Pseudomonadales bacterium]|jgi:hypothetical protein|nr:hypothetical protein [Pseudomonadales bacterium]
MQTSGDNKPGWAENPVVHQRIRYGLFIICGLLVIVDLIVHRHTYLPVEELPAFYAFYGFGALVGVVVLAKTLRLYVGRNEDYYQQDQHGEKDDA